MQTSLRSKTTVSKGPRPTAKLNKPNKNARKSKVDDKIKRRMSARYATISAPTPTDTTTPSVPTIPLDLRGNGLVPIREKDETSQVQTLTKEDLRAAENKLLDVEDFDPDAYLKLKLANSTEAELRLLQSSLRNSKDEVAADLQRNVFKNYAQFVHISKEIGILENEMMGLKESLAEWKSMPSVLHIEESASVAERRRNVRSSVADLRVLYAHQMQNLHTQIEGSAKFVPTTPGRHVIAEMDSIFALNAATYKPMSVVRFVLLDDAVLVARRRRRRNASEILDTKDAATLVNVFKIKHGKETHVYRTDSASDKKSLLSQFRHVAEELAAKKRKEREGEHERRKSLWSGNARGSVAMGDVPPVPDWMSDLAQQAGMSDSAKENAERDARWIGDYADELNVAIALREWDRAVELPCSPLLCYKRFLTHRITKRRSRSLLPSSIASMQAPAARTAFLAARAETARRLVRMIRFDGHIGTYINDLSTTVFTVIKHTADWFLASFKENEMFRIQVFCTDVDQSVVDDALSITHNQSRKLLQEFGLDFRFILDALLVPNPLENVPPQVPILAPAPKASLPTFKGTDIPPRSTRSTPAPPEPVLGSILVSSPNWTPELSTRSGRTTPSSTPTPDLPPRILRNASATAALPSPLPTGTTGTPPPLPRTLSSASHPSTSSLSLSSSPSPTTLTTPPAFRLHENFLDPPSRGTTPVPTRAGTPTPGRAPTPNPSSIRSPSPAPVPLVSPSPRVGTLAARGVNPAPPPRSRERPGSAAGRERPPPVSVPRREGYF
ncbi:hypothetical protein EI94DRAFT_1763604 [Lactarius quietus]|nr:hypothetical protein EI94DRAFT_1763604 [Lactarius quietus]